MHENSQLHMEILRLKESGQTDDSASNDLKMLKSQNEDL